MPATKHLDINTQADEIGDIEYDNKLTRRVGLVQQWNDL